MVDRAARTLTSYYAYVDGLLAQLRPGGRLIAVEGSGNAAVAKIWINNDANISARPLHNCAIPPLAGFAKKPSFVF